MIIIWTLLGWASWWAWHCCFLSCASLYNLLMRQYWQSHNATSTRPKATRWTKPPEFTKQKLPGQCIMRQSREYDLGIRVFALQLRLYRTDVAPIERDNTWYMALPLWYWLSHTLQCICIHTCYGNNCKWTLLQLVYTEFIEFLWSTDIIHILYWLQLSSEA